jgi:hypothetical protein
MVITDTFVYIHTGKTGGTFVEKALDALPRKGRLYFNTANAPDLKFFRSVNQHETVAEIPEAYRGLKRLFTIRNPYDHYVSHYVYGAWKRLNHQMDYNKTKGKYPDYPDLPFPDFPGLHKRLELARPARWPRPAALGSRPLS